MTAATSKMVAPTAAACALTRPKRAAAPTTNRAQTATRSASRARPAAPTEPGPATRATARQPAIPATCASRKSARVTARATVPPPPAPAGATTSAPNTATAAATSPITAVSGGSLTGTVTHRAGMAPGRRRLNVPRSAAAELVERDQTVPAPAVRVGQQPHRRRCSRASLREQLLLPGLVEPRPLLPAVEPEPARVRIDPVATDFLAALPDSTGLIRRASRTARPCMPLARSAAVCLGDEVEVVAEDRVVDDAEACRVAPGSDGRLNHFADPTASKAGDTLRDAQGDVQRVTRI